jgi:hypothetical protein
MYFRIPPKYSLNHLQPSTIVHLLCFTTMYWLVTIMEHWMMWLYLRPIWRYCSGIVIEELRKTMKELCEDDLFSACIRINHVPNVRPFTAVMLLFCGVVYGTISRNSVRISVQVSAILMQVFESYFSPCKLERVGTLSEAPIALF